MTHDRLYKLLDVPRDATEPAIKKAYHKLARELHPDRNPDKPEAEARFKEINAAYEVLSDPKRRALYDEFGDEVLRPGFDPDAARAQRFYQERGGFQGFRGGDQPVDFDLDDLLGGLFGGGVRGAPRGGRDVHARVSLDFHTAAKGGQVELRTANGELHKVRVPAGVEDGETIRLRGRGQPGPNGAAPGDLLLTVQVEPDEVFRREGQDLYVEVPVTLGEALRGGTVQVPTLDGEVRLKVPPGSQSGARLRVRGKGIHRGNRPDGDLYAILQLRLPELSAEELERARDAIDALEALYNRGARSAA